MTDDGLLLELQHTGGRIEPLQRQRQFDLLHVHPVQGVAAGHEIGVFIDEGLCLEILAVAFDDLPQIVVGRIFPRLLQVVGEELVVDGRHRGLLAQRRAEVVYGIFVIGVVPGDFTQPVLRARVVLLLLEALLVQLFRLVQAFVAMGAQREAEVLAREGSRIVSCRLEGDDLQALVGRDSQAHGHELTRQLVQQALLVDPAPLASERRVV